MPKVEKVEEKEVESEEENVPEEKEPKSSNKCLIIAGFAFTLLIGGLGGAFIARK